MSLDSDEITEKEVDWGIKAVSWTWAAWTYLWGVIVNLITLAVILVIFSNAETKFESIVFSLLTLIYLIIVSYFTTHGYLQTEQWHTDYGRFKYLRNLLKEQLSEEDREYEIQEYDRIKKMWRHNKVKFWINAVFNSVFHLITLINLLRVTIFSSY